MLPVGISEPSFPSSQFYSKVVRTVLKLEIQKITQERKRG